MFFYKDIKIQKQVQRWFGRKPDKGEKMPEGCLFLSLDMLISAMLIKKHVTIIHKNSFHRTIYTIAIFLLHSTIMYYCIKFLDLFFVTSTLF